MTSTTKNKESTRYYSDLQEKDVCKLLGAYQQPNSGAGKFNKSDVIIPKASMSIECKTVMTPKESFSIKKDWIIKHKQESFSNGLCNQAIAFNFGPNEDNYFVIGAKLMKYLVECLEKEEL